MHLRAGRKNSDGEREGVEREKGRETDSQCVCASGNLVGKPDPGTQFPPSQGINRQLRILLYLMAKC